MKKLLIIMSIFLVNLWIFSNSNAFLYGSIFSLESINTAKSNGIELSPPFNSRTYCLIQQRRYNHLFKDYIRSTCFQKVWDIKYYYLICDASKFSDCSVDKYLGSPLNEEELKWNIWWNNNWSEIDQFNNNKDLKQEILDKVNKILEYQKNTIYSSDLEQRSQFIYDKLNQILSNNNQNYNKKLYDFVDRIYKKQNLEEKLDLSKLYTIDSMLFVEEDTNETFSLRDLLRWNVWKKDLEKVYKINLILKDSYWIKYNVNLKITKKENGQKEYEIEDVINWIFMDNNWKEYEIEDVISDIFEQWTNVNNNGDINNNENVGNEDLNNSSQNQINLDNKKELSLQEIMNMVFKEDE